VAGHLDKLDKARKVYRKAEHYRRTGRCDTACEYYERAQQLCPGSRFDHLATKHLRELYAQRAAAAHGGCEESEGLSPKPAKPELLPPPHQVPQGSDAPEDDVFLWPALPPVDPQTAQAMDRLLILWATGRRRKPCARWRTPDASGSGLRRWTWTPLLGLDFGGTEEAEPAILSWQSACPEVLLPSLFALPVGEPSVVPSEELKELLCQFLALAAAGGCAEIDVASPQRPRFRCDLQIGGLTLEMKVNNDGHGYVQVGWVTEESCEAPTDIGDQEV